MSKNLGDSELLLLLTGRYGTRTTVNYYLQKAVNASRRAKVNLVGDKEKAFIADAQEAFLNLEMIYKILGDDNNILDEPKKK